MHTLSRQEAHSQIGKSNRHCLKGQDGRGRRARGTFIIPARSENSRHRKKVSWGFSLGCRIARLLGTVLLVAVVLQEYVSKASAPTHLLTTLDTIPHIPESVLACP